MIRIEQIEDLIEKEIYITTHSKEYFGDNGQLTICILKTKSGFECIGKSGTITPQQNFDAELGKKFARENAINELWAAHAYFVQHNDLTTPFTSDHA